jgi:hypothetical protein
MANVQIGKYKRPGIFIEEFDRSIIASPVLEGITNLVIGVSKKGPYNTPIRLTSISDLEAIYGDLDRNLERKGSFFHRTISKMLEIAPVFAMNLLLTDDSLDRLEYKSLSASSGSDNDVKRDGAYRRFFDTTGFWKRDTDSFIDLTRGNTGFNERVINLTNLSDKPVTAFVFKTQRSGFDRTLLEWYGTIEKMPTYVNRQDWASDYMVDVVVVGGDWSDYQALAVDPRWSNFFNTSGLIKSEMRNFANDRNISLLAYYEGLSLIPYFRDETGRNIFIETVINRDTDRTGLFCSFNSDLVEEDYYTGKVDLLGNTIVGKNETNINFLSYKELISENIEIESKALDTVGNVTGILSGSFSYIDQTAHAFGGDISGGVLTTGIIENAERTAWFAEGSVYRVTEDSYVGTTSSITVEYSVESDSFAVIGDKYVSVLESNPLVINVSDYPVNPSATASYTAAFVLNNTGEIVKVATLVPGVNPVVSQSDIVLGFVTFDVTPSGEFANDSMNSVTVGTSGYIDLDLNTDFTITDLGNGDVKFEFLGTSGQQIVSNYVQYRKFKTFNRILSLLDSSSKVRSTMNLGPNLGYRKVSMSGMSVANIVTSQFQDKSFVLSTGLESVDLVNILNGYFVFYTTDNEFILGERGVTTKDEIADLSSNSLGVVARYSVFYSRYFDGIINTRDFFWSNRLWVDRSNLTNSLLGETVDITFIDGEDAAGVTSSYAGKDYVVFKSDDNTFEQQVDFGVFEKLVFPGSSLNQGSYTIVDLGGSVGGSGALAAELGFSNSLTEFYFAYEVSEEVESEVIFDQSVVRELDKKHYLKMFIDNEVLLVEFKDELLESIVAINIEANNTIDIQSRKSNLKQTLEIEVPSNYVQTPNKVLVDAARYTEVVAGDFLEALVDENELQVGEAPRRLTRILSKRRYSEDSSLVEITCDSPIKRYNFSGDLQTFRYKSIDNYATTYKAITLKGFKLRMESLPDGTEAKQNDILNIVAKGTPLFKALTNKDAIDFRYLIDSFGLGLRERSKQQLVDICGARLDVFGFINMPSMKQFKNSSSPSFVNAENVLQVEFIAKGGDPESSPAFLYSFAEGAGTTAVGYFAPYLQVNDNGRPIEVPPASYVATTYMRKHISNITSIVPWTIAAGVTNGRITGITGLEMDFTNSDIEFMNQAQMNPIVFKRNRGFVIETENTGQTLVRSSLSLIHVREVLIELERELAAMLLDYQWKFNTPDVRAEIKLKADVICDTFVSKNGLFNYFNKMDDENNTPDIIDNQIGVIDTYIEVIKGMGIIVNNITILRTGAISAGGFIGQ